MTPAELAIALLQLAAAEGPEAASLVRKLLAAVWQEHRVDLGPMPPDLSDFDAIDAKIDAALAKKR